MIPDSEFTSHQHWYRITGNSVVIHQLSQFPIIYILRYASKRVFQETPNVAFNTHHSSWRTEHSLNTQERMTWNYSTVSEIANNMRYSSAALHTSTTDMLNSIPNVQEKFPDISQNFSVLYLLTKILYLVIKQFVIYNTWFRQSNPYRRRFKTRKAPELAVSSRPTSYSSGRMYDATEEIRAPQRRPIGLQTSGAIRLGSE